MNRFKLAPCSVIPLSQPVVLANKQTFLRAPLVERAHSTFAGNRQHYWLLRKEFGKTDGGYNRLRNTCGALWALGDMQMLDSNENAQPLKKLAGCLFGGELA